jgi:hypothetical protein
MWRKKGILLDVNQNKALGLLSHASVPFAFHLQENVYRVFFSSRDALGRSQPFYVDAQIVGEELKLIGGIVGPLFDFGPLGTFDESGVMPSSVVRNGEEVWMYYIGWNPEVRVSYRLSIGLAVSKDGGQTFERSGDGPLLDRSFNEPFFNSAPYVFWDKNIWRMFYVSGTGWINHLDRKEPLYLIRHTTSKDGLNWHKPGEIAIGYTEEMESIGRPCVLRNGDQYEMYFSHRMARDYRDQQKMSYKIGSAKSSNASDWEDYRYDLFHDMPQDWDGLMYEYCHVFVHGDKKFMLYNGNGFGQQGFGYAVMDL